MATRVASLFAEIGLKTDKLDAGLKQSRQALKQTADDFKTTGGRIASFKQSLGGMATAATGAMGVVTGSAILIKKAFDFGKEGANLLMMEDRFDKLAVSIGTTSDALMTDLKTATRGMLSDAELVQSATNLMALGLAKTKDEAVRLAKVSSALNMDMNQLVLTLTNQTTMRFDALGVSVDGFEEKVNKLKKAGMDANTAFKMAFLEQAEDQVRLLGEAADTAAGKFMQAESSVKNFGDAIKKNLTVELAKGVDAFNILTTGLGQIAAASEKHDREVLALGLSYEDYANEMIRTGIVLNTIDQYQGDLLLTMMASGDATGRNKEIMLELAKTVGLLTQEEYSLAVVEARLGDDRRESIGLLEGQKDAIKGVANSYGSIADKARSAEDASRKLFDVMSRDIASPIENFRKDLEWTAAGGDKINEMFAEVQEALAQHKITPAQADEYLQALETAAVDLSVELDQTSLKDATKTLVDNLDMTWKEAGEAIKSTDGIQGALDSLTLMEGEMGLMGKFGTTLTEVRNMISAAGGGGPMSVQGAIDSLNSQEAADNISNNLGKQIQTASDRVKGNSNSIYSNLMAITSHPWNVNVKIKMSVTGNNPLGVSGGILAGTFATGGYALPGRPYLVGEKGPEIFVPNTSGQVIPNNQLKSGGGNTFGDINIFVDGGDADATADAVFSRFSEATRAASNAGIGFAG